MPFDDVWNHTGSFKDRAAENKEILMIAALILLGFLDSRPKDIEFEK